MDFTVKESIDFEKLLVENGYNKSNQSHHLEDYGWYKPFKQDDVLKYQIYFGIYDWTKYKDRDPNCKDRIGVSFMAIFTLPGFERYDIMAMPVKDENDSNENILSKFENHVEKLYKTFL